MFYKNVLKVESYLTYFFLPISPLTGVSTNLVKILSYFQPEKWLENTFLNMGEFDFFLIFHKIDNIKLYLCKIFIGDKI